MHVYTFRRVLCLVLITILFNAFLRREALSIWQHRCGSGATYCKLISAFQDAGYQSHADDVESMIIANKRETVDCSSTDYPLPQPQTYPLHEPPKSFQFPSSVDHEVSSQEKYIEIDSEIAKSLPKGICCIYQIVHNAEFELL